LTNENTRSGAILSDCSKVISVAEPYASSLYQPTAWSRDVAPANVGVAPACDGVE